MLTKKPSFPAFDEWARMSEQQQDVLIARMEKVQRRRRWLVWTGLCVGSLAAFSFLLSKLS